MKPPSGPVRRLAVVLAALALCGGCADVGYYLQAINGHAQLLHRTRPIAELLREPDLPAARRRRLREVLAIRDFASAELALPNNGSYRSFAAVKGPAVVWSLVATPAFSLVPLQWCYPVLGCASYRGYFVKADAQARAARLKARGRDVTVAPVPAYSTLGWLSDPLPATVVDWPEPQLAGLIFHELAHQRLYLAGDSSFNESFAVAVERAGVRRWLRHRGDARGLREWRDHLQRQAAFLVRIQAARQRLQALYARPLGVAGLRRLKAAEFQRLHRELERLAGDGPGGAWLRGWLRRPLNNARLALLDTYRRWVPAFERLLCDNGGDFAAFYRAARRLSELPAAAREARLRALADQPSRRSCE